MSVRMIGAVTPLAALLLALTACGGSTPSGQAATGPPAPGTAASAGQDRPPPAAPNNGAQTFCRLMMAYGGELLANAEHPAAQPDAAARINGDWQRTVAAAPTEIKADTQTVADGVSAIIGGDPARAEQPDFRAAYTRFTTYVAAHCGDIAGN